MNRRESLKALAIGALTPEALIGVNPHEVLKQGINALLGDASPNQPFLSSWQAWPDMEWVGSQFWPNPMQDWRVRNGKVECSVEGVNRSLHSLTCQLGEAPLSFETSIIVSFHPEIVASPQNFAGFRLGAKGKFKDYRSAAVFGEGLEAGLTTDGILFIGDIQSKEKLDLKGSILLRLQVIPTGGKYRLSLVAHDAMQKNTLAQVLAEGISNEQLTGNIALVGHIGAKKQDQENAAGNATLLQDVPIVPFTFSSWEIKGPKVIQHPDQAFGPIFFAQYTLHQKTVKLTAQLAPVEAIAGLKVVLQVKKKGKWEALQETTLDPLSRIAHFRIENWSAREAVPYRIQLELPLLNGLQTFDYQGTIAAEPLEAEKLKVAVFSCNCDYGFPDAEVAPHVAKHKPDLAVFLGDQFYESTGGFGIQTSPLEKAALDYLRKWYMFGWSYREVFRHIPVAFIPDDHDVYHGNLWGEGGKHAPTDQGWTYVAQDQGGYKMTPEWVNMVQRTQTSHLPDPYNSTPVQQGIGVYYTNWNYGGVSFAILEDRKFKSAPKNVLPPEAQVENGFITNPAFDIKKHREVDAQLLGERQLSFLNEWIGDWKDGVQMKAVLSQTNFCTVATLPQGSTSDKIVPKLPIPKPGEYPSGDAPTVDMDSNGWPQQGRDQALKLMRKAFSFHIAGDQHLASTVQYGVDEFGDAGYAFAGPALNNLWPRRWWPGIENKEPLLGEPAYTGNFFDGFGNRMTVHAVANPHQTGLEPAIIYDRATGYGIVSFDKKERQIKIECWPRYVNPIKDPQGQYPGWPVTIKQDDNYGRKAVALLPEIKVKGLKNPVIKVVEEGNGELVYALRIAGNRFKPKVFAEGTYTITISEPDKGIHLERNGVIAQKSTNQTLYFSL